jgi:nucleotide-binding universal stress UspA family protein
VGAIRSIVVPTDFSALSEAAAARAATLARLDGAAIHLVHAVSLPLVVTPYDVAIPARIWDEVRSAAKEQLEQRRKQIESLGVQTVTAELAESTDPSRAIAEAAEAHQADLVVMGTHGHRGIERAFLGSVAERTLRTLECPILAVKEDAERAAEPIRRILLAVDFSADSARAVEVAADLARRLGAHVDVVHALELPRDHFANAAAFGIELEERIRASVALALDDVGQQLEKKAVTVTLLTRPGRPSAVIAEVAEEIGCQLIVMGTRGRSGLSHVLLGSVAERTLRMAPCAVLVVRSREHHDGR